MAPPSRTVGLPIHLFYPIISAILLGVAAFPTADAVWYVSAQTNELAVSFPFPLFSHPSQRIPEAHVRSASLPKTSQYHHFHPRTLICPSASWRQLECHGGDTDPQLRIQRHKPRRQYKSRLRIQRMGMADPKSLFRFPPP
jgi:hypothetical protein